VPLPPLSFAHRPPLKSEPLRIRELEPGQFRGNSITNPNPIDTRSRTGPGNRQVQPLIGLNVVLRNTHAFVVQQPKHVLGCGISLIGGTSIPDSRLNLILRDTTAVGVHEPEDSLSARVPVSSQGCKNSNGSCIVLSGEGVDTIAVRSRHRGRDRDHEENPCAANESSGHRTTFEEERREAFWYAGTMRGLRSTCISFWPLATSLFRIAHDRSGSSTRYRSGTPRNQEAPPIAESGEWKLCGSTIRNIRLKLSPSDEPRLNLKKLPQQSLPIQKS